MFEAFGLDIKLIVAQIINFGLFFIVFKTFLSKPFLTMLKQEKEKTESIAEKETKLAAQEEAMQTAMADMKRKVGQEREKLMEETKQAAISQHDAIVAKAKESADSMLTSVTEELKAKRAEFEKDITRVSIDTSIEMINKALSHVLTPEVQEKLTQHIVKNAPIAK